MNSYYTCQELLDLHGAAKLLRWSPVKIGVFYNCMLLDGRGFGKQSRVMITETSFKQLIEYVHKSIDIVDSDPIFLAYDEVMEMFPQADSYRWSPTAIGYFYHSLLLKGKKSQKESRYLVSKQSVIRLIEYTNQRFRDIASKPFL